MKNWEKKRKTLKRAHVKFIYKITDASGNDLIKFFFLLISRTDVMCNRPSVWENIKWFGAYLTDKFNLRVFGKWKIHMQCIM